MTPYDDDQDLHLGACCYCVSAPATVIAMLAIKVPVQYRNNTGWGCVACGLPEEGALSVLCEACAQELEADDAAQADFFAAPMICLGYPKDNVREPVLASDMDPHEHDLRYHPEIRER